MRNNIYATYSAAIVMVVAMCVGFFVIALNAASAQEETGTDDETESKSSVEIEITNADEDKWTSEEREEMEEMMESLQQNIRLRNTDAQRAAADLEIERVELETEVETESEELIRRPTEFIIDRLEFMASLAGLSEEEKRAAMLGFIAELRAEIAKRKAAIQAAREERIAAIMEQVKELRAKLQERKEAKANNENEDTVESDGIEDEIEYNRVRY